MLNRILQVTIALISSLRIADAVDIGNGASFDVIYQTDKNLLKFEATLLPNTWLGLGFGSGMV